MEKPDKIHTAKAFWILFKIQLEIFIRKMTTLEKQRQLLEKLEKKFSDKNWEKAEELYKTQYFKDNFVKNMEAKRLFSEHELKRFLDNKNIFQKNLKRMRTLCVVLEKIEKKVKKIKAYYDTTKLVIDLNKRAGKQRNEFANADEEKMIDLMKEAKDSMNQIVNLVTSFGSIPILSDIIGQYGEFFKATDKFFNIVAAYSKRINEETKKIPDHGLVKLKEYYFWVEKPGNALKYLHLLE